MFVTSQHSTFKSRYLESHAIKVITYLNGLSYQIIIIIKLLFNIIINLVHEMVYQNPSKNPHDT